MWQDIAIAVIQWGLALFLLPAVLHATAKPPMTTSIPTALGLFLLAGIFLSLSFWWAALAAATPGVMWCILAYQRYVLDQ